MGTFSVFFFKNITGENTVNSYEWVPLVVFFAYYWWKHGNKLYMCTFSGFVCILLVETR